MESIVYIHWSVCFVGIKEIIEIQLMVCINIEWNYIISKNPPIIIWMSYFEWDSIGLECYSIASLIEFNGGFYYIYIQLFVLNHMNGIDRNFNCVEWDSLT